MKIKTTPTFHLTPIRMAVFKSKNTKKCWLQCGETGTLYTVGGNENYYNQEQTLC
jgi:hypothetical protein